MRVRDRLAKASREELLNVTLALTDTNRWQGERIAYLEALTELLHTKVEIRNRELARLTGGRMPFEAQYDGVCCKCDGHISPGQVIEYVSDSPDRRKTSLAHVECPEAKELERPKGDPCPRCFLWHPTEECE